MGLSAGVLGASGYAGGELLRLLYGHPAIEVTAAAGGRAVGGPVSDSHPNLVESGSLLQPVEEVLDAEVDVLFSCLPSGHLGGMLGRIRGAPVVIDLADDHRREPAWTYGLVEYNRGHLPSKRVANPGCYPTAALLALLPFAQADVIEEGVHVVGLSGASGAGRSSEDRLMFSSVAQDTRAYGDIPHRHVPEMEHHLHELGRVSASVWFIPHLVPMTRGLLITAEAPLRKTLTDAEALRILHERYEGDSFISIVEDWPRTAAVAGTNRALLSARVYPGNRLILSAAIDNLGKGAAGQALQNANLCLGLDEGAGLQGVAAWP